MTAFNWNILTPKNRASVRSQDMAAQRSQSAIVLHEFIDYYYDASGFYTLGHHADADVWTAVVKRSLGLDRSTCQVRRTWAQITGKDFKEVGVAIANAKPVTLIVINRNAKPQP